MGLQWADLNIQVYTYMGIEAFEWFGECTCF